MEPVTEGVEMIPARRASQEAAVAVYGNDEGADGVTSSNKYVTFEQEAENKKKKKTGAKPAAGTGSDRRATRVSLDSLLGQVKHDKGGMSEKEKRLMKVLNDLDADHDGTVSLMEIAELGSKLEQAEEDEKKLKKIVGVLSLLLIGSLLAIFIMSYAAAEAAKEVRISASGNSVKKEASTIDIPASERDGSRRRLGGGGGRRLSIGNVNTLPGNDDAGRLSAQLGDNISPTPSKTTADAQDISSIATNFDGTPATSTSDIPVESTCRNKELTTDPDKTCAWCIDAFIATDCGTSCDSGKKVFDAWSMLQAYYPVCEAECHDCAVAEISQADATAFGGQPGCKKFRTDALSSLWSDEDCNQDQSPATAKETQEQESTDCMDRCIAQNREKTAGAAYVNPPACQECGVCISADGSQIAMTTGAGCDVGANQNNLVNIDAVTSSIGTSIATPIDLGLDKMKQVAMRFAEYNAVENWEAETHVCEEVAANAVPNIQSGETRYVVANPCLSSGVFVNCPRMSIVEHEARTLERQTTSKLVGEVAYQAMPELEFDVTVATPVTVTPSECNRMEFSLPLDGDDATTSEKTDAEKARDRRIVLTPDGGMTLGSHVRSMFHQNNWYLPGQDSVAPGEPLRVAPKTLRVIMHCDSFTVNADDICTARAEVDKAEADASYYAVPVLSEQNGEADDKATISVLPEYTSAPTELKDGATFMETIRDYEQ